MIFGLLKELSAETFSARNAAFPSSSFLSGCIKVSSVLMGQNKNAAKIRSTIKMDITILVVFLLTAIGVVFLNEELCKSFIVIFVISTKEKSHSLFDKDC